VDRTSNANPIGEAKRSGTPGPVRERFWLTVLTVILCTVSACTAAAMVAGCGPGLGCIASIPYAMMGGVLFAPFFIIPIIVAVVVITQVVKIRLTLVSIVLLTIVAGGLGFLFGLLPGIQGHVP
jgi:uncharacterized membrane protein